MKNLFLTVLITVIMALSFGSLFAQTVMIELLDSEGNYPSTDKFQTVNDLGIRYTAWIVGEEEDTQNEQMYIDASRYYDEPEALRYVLYLLLDNFEAYPVAGQTLIVDILQEGTGHTAYLEYLLPGPPVPSVNVFFGEDSLHLSEPPVAIFDSNDDDPISLTGATLMGGYPADNVYRANGWTVNDYWKVEFSTTGYEDLSLTSMIRRQFDTSDPFETVSGPRFFQTQYRVDEGDSWTVHGGSHFHETLGDYWLLPDNESWVNMSFDLPSEFCDDQETVWVRWLVVSANGISGNGWGEIKDVVVTGEAMDVVVDPKPVAAVNPTPANNATGIAVGLESIQWQYIVDAGHTNPLWFRVYFSDDELDLGIPQWVEYVDAQVAYSFDLPIEDLTYETPYFWKVVPTTSLPVRSETTRNNRFRGNADNYYRGEDADGVVVWKFTTAEEPLPDNTYEDGLTQPEPGVDPPTENYSGNVGGAEIVFIPKADEIFHLNIDVLVSTNYDEYASNFNVPAALGRFFRFTVSDVDAFANGKIQLHFAEAPTQIWYRPAGGTWVQIPEELIDRTDPLKPIITLVTLIEVSRIPIPGEFEFAGDNGTQTLPVELSSFAVSLTAERFVKLQWISETETNMLGYNVYRANTNKVSEAVKLNHTVFEAANTSQRTTYTFNDENVQPGNSYYYWLQSVDLDLTNSFHGPISIVLDEAEEIVPEIFTTALKQNYPNPFNPVTTINYSLREDTSMMELKVYNVLGQVVKTLHVGPQAEGRHTVQWDGTNDEGKSVTSGIYFYRLTTDHYSSINKMMLVK